MRHGFSIATAALVLTIFAAVPPGCFGQWPVGVGFRGGNGTGNPIFSSYGGGGGYSPFVGVFAPYMGGYNYGGYDPRVASVPSAAYFTYGRTSYTTESPSPIPVYGPTPAYAPLPQALPLTALLQVQVPADAEVWLEGQKMRSTGLMRLYRSPPLDPAKGYVYEVHARWLIDGKPVEDVRRVAVRAGATLFVDFTHLDALAPHPLGSTKPPAKKSDTPSADQPTR